MASENRVTSSKPRVITRGKRARFWVNKVDGAGSKLHKATCKHVRNWAHRYPHNWKRFSTEAEARATIAALSECGDCY